MHQFRLTIAAFLAFLVLLTALDARALQCVPFAREVSGISLRGDAWTWWTAALGQYDRGQAPQVGAVVVFKKHGGMRYGHVAVVAQVISSREVLVNHANWAPHRGSGRGQIAKMVAVTDISPRNDWTEVRVWNAMTGDFGTKVYPTYGFIYARAMTSPYGTGQNDSFVSSLSQDSLLVMAQSSTLIEPVAEKRPSAPVPPVAKASVAPLEALADLDDIGLAKRFGSGRY
ncbi:MAG TPA: CHAP domain-containing protein [Rhodospirillaceae bacterium]|nr:CHAP domain-containing protein [Rhodospirillaceae bacterium]